MKVGFIGLGNVGGKLAGSFLRNGYDLMVRDLERGVAQPVVDAGARFAESPRDMAEQCDLVITCLPSPAASAAVMEADDGLLAGFGPGKIWAEMSTTDEAEVVRLGAKVRATGASPVDCPVSGGCHRAATGNIGEAAELVLEMQTEIEELTANAFGGSGLSYFHELDNTLYSVTSSTFIGAVYALFGLENVADPADADGAAFGYPQLSDEYLVDADPDIIFLADTICCGQSAETVAERAGWDQLAAVQNGTVIELNDDIVSRWGPRLVDFIEAIALAVESATVPA